MQTNLKQTTTELMREIEAAMAKTGILCRVFGRNKTRASIDKKLTRYPEKYSIGGRLIQDVIGIRIVLYFQEDIDIVKKVLCSKYEFNEKSSTIDVPTTDQFSVTRYNLIYKLPGVYLNGFETETKSLPIDKSFEIQLRSMLSEGWHEVEHDLRYKSKGNWVGQDDLSRALNGIMATLETSEWGMKKVFDDLAYRHYKNKQWEAMLQNKLRMKIETEISDDLTDLLDKDANLAKEVYRIEKVLLLGLISKLDWNLPLNLSNVLYLWNYFYILNVSINKITPQLLLNKFSELKTRV